MENEIEVFLYGASGHGKVIVEILEANKITVGAIFDDHSKIEKLLQYPVLGSFDPAVLKKNMARVLISIGNNAIRKKIALTLPAIFTVAIHPSANISPRCHVGRGTVIMAGVSVNCDVSIGEHAILNTNASIDHDCVIDNYVHISPNAALAGNVSIGEGTHVGIGAVVIQGVKIGKWCTIGAGTVIINDIPDYAVVVGNPGKIIKYNPEII